MTRSVDSQRNRRGRLGCFKLTAASYLDPESRWGKLALECFRWSVSCVDAHLAFHVSESLDAI